MVEGETAGVAVVEKKRSQDKEDSEEVAAIGRQSWKVPGRKQDQQWEERRLEPRQPGKQWTSQAGCSRCGYEHKPRQCPAYGKKCAKCRVLGHFARVCRARDRTTHMISDTLSESGSEEAVLLITVEKIGKKLLARVPLRGRDRVETIECQLDTAASCNVMSVLDYEKLGKPKLRNSRTTLSMYDGTARKSLGVVQVGVSNREGKPTQLVFELLETRHHTLLSLDTCLKLSYEIESVCLAEAKLKLTRKHILEEYSDVFSGIGCLPGKYNIQTDPSIPPVQNRPRRIPHVMKALVIQKLRSLEKSGMIARVEEPTEWISNLTAVWKSDKTQVRVCLDPRDLNKAILRNHFKMPTLDDVLPELTGAKIFSILDAKDGFLQIRLSEHSSKLTTFWGPDGRYRWLQMPFGLSSAPEEFQRRLQGALHGIQGVVVVADDILVFGKGKTEEEAREDHDKALLQLLHKARDQNLKFNKDKMRLHLSELIYIGHRVSAQGVRPDPAKVSAVKNMAVPTSASDVRRFLGMCNYLARFIPKLSQSSEPLRRLTEGDTEFVWGQSEQAAFDLLKKIISEEQLLTFYDVKKSVVIQCDASGEGLGATLLQEGKPVASASRSLTSSERNYVALELECLAIVFACRKFDQYIYGKKTVVETDHKPLEIIAKKSLLSAPRRLQRMLLQLQRYDLEVVYRPGEQQLIADTLSRLPAGRAEAEKLENYEVFQIGRESMRAEVVAQELSVIEQRDFVRISDQRMDEVKKAASSDDEQRVLAQVIGQGWPATTCIREVSTLVRPYWNFRDTMVVQDGIVYKGGQVVVPKSLRSDYLKRLHSSHMGSESTLRRARDAVYWPNMSEDIKRITSECKQCEEDGAAQSKEPQLAHAIPKYPWSKVGIDLCRCNGKDWVVIVDYLTDFIEVSELQQTLATTVIDAIKQNFARHGVPVLVHTDGGPQFTSQEFQVFSKEWEFAHTVSSPYHSQSNGKVESAVKIVKRLFKRSADPYLALLEWRNTPTVGLDSTPCQRLFARRTRGVVPVSAWKLDPAPAQRMWEKKVERQRSIQGQAKGNGKILQPLKVGDPVLVQDLRAKKTEWMRGYCRGQLSDRSYTGPAVT